MQTTGWQVSSKYHYIRAFVLNPIQYHFSSLLVFYDNNSLDLLALKKNGPRSKPSRFHTFPNVFPFFVPRTNKVSYDEQSAKFSVVLQTAVIWEHVCFTGLGVHRPLGFL
jgi:hypothetical protein